MPEECAPSAGKERPCRPSLPVGLLRAQFFFAANPISAPQILIEEGHETEISDQQE